MVCITLLKIPLMKKLLDSAFVAFWHITYPKTHNPKKHGIWSRLSCLALYLNKSNNSPIINQILVMCYCFARTRQELQTALYNFYYNIKQLCAIFTIIFNGQPADSKILVHVDRPFVFSIWLIVFAESITIAQWPVAALLFAYEHSNAPYVSTQARKISLKLLSTLKVLKDVVERVFEFLKPRLTRESWKFYIGKFIFYPEFRCFIFWIYKIN